MKTAMVQALKWSGRVFALQAEARRFLSALGRRAVQSGNSFSVHQLFDLSDHLQLKVPDMRLFIDQLNDAGMFSVQSHSSLLHGSCMLQSNAGQSAIIIAFVCLWWVSTHVCLSYEVSVVASGLQVSCSRKGHKHTLCSQYQPMLVSLLAARLAATQLPVNRLIIEVRSSY